MAILICARCGQEKYANHSPVHPHGSTFGGACEAYLPAHPCVNCAKDVEEHEPYEPHPRIIAEEEVCQAVNVGGWEEATFEGGGGSSGGGGASGGW